MPRVFNTAGPCLPEKHYMLSPERRLGEILDLVAGEFYFVIHAPRQTGKTTLIRALSHKLTSEGSYAALTVSLESFTGPEPEQAMPSIVDHIKNKAAAQLPAELRPPGHFEGIHSATLLNHFLSAWSNECPRPVVIFFDEIDAMQGEVLISVLRQLRDGYTSRPAPFPQSVALVGLRDVRDYKIKVREGRDSLGTSSPFNIKSDSLTLSNFTQQEVGELLDQHTQETGQRFEPEAQAEVFEQTSGQPWLVNALAAQLTTRYDALVKDRTAAVTRDHVLDAREILIERRDTHLDSLVDKLREARIQRVIEPLLIGAADFDPTFNDDFLYASDLGLVSRQGGNATIANRIYQEIIPRVLSFHVQMGIADEPAWYVAEDGTLDLRKLIDGFLEFWRENGEVLLRGMPYQEAAPHLVFMAYLQRIVNAGGRIDREFAIGTKRADLVVRYGGRSDVIELKLLSAPKALSRGLAQVSAYAKRLGRDTGFLVLFDRNSDTPWEERGSVEDVPHDGVTVVVTRA